MTATNASRSLPGRTRIRTKILVPSMVLFTFFALVVVLYFTRIYTRESESRVVEQLRGDGVLLERILRDEEDRIALHARFMADMVGFSEQFSGVATGRSVLIYLLEYLQQEGVEIQIYSGADQTTRPFGELVRKGLLGIRTNSLVAAGDAERRVLSIASVAPIERTPGSGEVIVTWLPLHEERLGDLKNKLGVDLGLVHDGRIVASTLPDPACRAVVDGMITASLQENVLSEGQVVVRDLDCDGDPQMAIFSPLEVGFEPQAICVLSVSLQDILAARRKVVVGTVLSAGLMLFVVALVYSMVVRRITKPLQDLCGVTERVGERDFGPKVVVASGDEIGELAGSFNVMLDRLETSERELERAHEKEMERADRMATIGQLSSGIAHEIRNPLAGIRGAMHVLEREESLSATRKELLREVLEQIARMDKLTRDLLDYSKPAAARLAPSDLNQIVDRALFLTPLEREGSKVTVHKDYDPQLPNPRVDPRQVQQVLLNVLLNAIQAIDGDGSIRIKTTRQEFGGHSWIMVEVQDDGVGMSAETLQQASRPFFTTKVRGTGLGLSIAQQIMRSHGGRIEIDSDPNGGTRLRLLFPM